LSNGDANSKIMILQVLAGYNRAKFPIRCEIPQTPQVNGQVQIGFERSLHMIERLKLMHVR
jgi:hypothetical protein